MTEKDTKPVRWRCSQCGATSTSIKQPAPGKYQWGGDYPCRGPERGEDYMAHRWVELDRPATLEWLAQEFASQLPAEYDKWEGLHFEVGCGIYLGLCADGELGICGCRCRAAPITEREFKGLAVLLGIDWEK